MIYKWENEHYDYPQLSVFDDLCLVPDFISKICESKIDDDILLYIHIPFCSSKCVFCNYYKISNFTERLLDDYFECLKIEIKSYANIIPLNKRKLIGIQFGGGTPSVVPIKYYVDLISCIKKYFSIDSDATISFEGNIKSLNSRTYIYELKQIGINRVSFGIQSFKEEIRKKWLLTSTESEVDKLIDLLIENGINNYNSDLMYNFPSQTVEDVISDISKAFSKNIKTIDLYSLIVLPNTNMCNILMKDNFYNEYKSGKSVLKYQNMYNILAEDSSIFFMMSNTISKSPMNKYKNLHVQLGNNKLNGGTVIGIGASARGFISGIAYKNHVNIDTYISSVIQHEFGVSMMNQLSYNELENKLLVMFPNFTYINKKDLNLSNNNSIKLANLIKSGVILENDEQYYIPKKNLFWAGKISSMFFSREQTIKMTKSVLLGRKNNLNLYNQDDMNMRRTNIK